MDGTSFEDQVSVSEQLFEAANIFSDRSDKMTIAVNRLISVNAIGLFSEDDIYRLAQELSEVSATLENLATWISSQMPSSVNKEKEGARE